MAAGRGALEVFKQRRHIFSPYMGIRSVLSRGLAGVSPTADQALVENADLFRTWNGFDNDRIKVLLGPHAPYTCPDDYMEKVIAYLMN